MSTVLRNVDVNERALRYYCEEQGVKADTVDALLKAAIKIIWKEIGDRPQEKDRSTCSRCRNYILDDDKFCWYCGDDVAMEGDPSEGQDFDAMFPEEVEAEPPEELPEEEVVEEKPKKSKKKSKRQIKKPDKKAKKKKESEPEPEPEPEEAPEEEPESTTAGDSATLQERTERILSLGRTTGVAAWDMGSELSIIRETQQYLDGKFEDFTDYCKRALETTRASAVNYIRIFSVFSRDDAAQLEVGKLLMLARVTDDAKRDKLLQRALPKEVGGKALPREKLAEEVKTLREKAGVKSQSPGRPRVNKGWASITGNTFRGNWSNEEHTRAIVSDADIMGETVGLQVTVLKKGVKVEIVELEKD